MDRLWKGTLAMEVPSVAAAHAAAARASDPEDDVQLTIPSAASATGSGSYGSVRFRSVSNMALTGCSDSNGSTRFGSTRFHSVRFHPVPLGSVPTGCTRLHSVRFHSVPLGSIPLCSVPTRSTRFHSIPTDSTRFGSTRFLLRPDSSACDLVRFRRFLQSPLMFLLILDFVHGFVDGRN